MSLLQSFDVQQFGFNGLWEPHVDNYLRSTPSFLLRVNRADVKRIGNQYHLRIEKETETFIEAVYERVNAYHQGHFGLTIATPINNHQFQINCDGIDISLYGQIIELRLQFVGGTYNKGREVYFHLRLKEVKTSPVVEDV